MASSIVNQSSSCHHFSHQYLAATTLDDIDLTAILDNDDEDIVLDFDDFGLLQPAYEENKDSQLDFPLELVPSATATSATSSGSCTSPSAVLPTPTTISRRRSISEVTVEEEDDQGQEERQYSHESHTNKKQKRHHDEANDSTTNCRDNGMVYYMNGVPTIGRPLQAPPSLTNNFSSNRRHVSAIGSQMAKTPTPTAGVVKATGALHHYHSNTHANYTNNYASNVPLLPMPILPTTLQQPQF